MYAPLVNITIDSIYGGPLNQKMALCTPDMRKSLQNISNFMLSKNNNFRLTDLYRSYQMQQKAHEDYMNNIKTAFSPPPGGSMHEAGRAFDFELNDLKHITLPDFWDLAKAYNIVPIISIPDSNADEAWHFECRGSHQIVYDYYLKGFGSNFKEVTLDKSAYRAMAASAIISTGCKVDNLGLDPIPGYIQSGLIRLGVNIGNLDGNIGPQTLTGLANIGINTSSNLIEIGNSISKLLEATYPNEYL